MNCNDKRRHSLRRSNWRFAGMIALPIAMAGGASAEPPAAPASIVAQPAACNPANFRIAVDVGHTETNYGAVSAHGIPEYEFNLRLAQELVQQLWAKDYKRAEVVTQVDSDLPRRARDLSSRRPDIMLSLHHDSVQDKYLKTGMLDGQMRTYTDGFHGYSIFISRENAHLDASERFAELLGTEMRAQGNVLTPTDHHETQENRQPFDKPNGIYFYDGLAVLRLTAAPAVLLESAVITDVSDEQKANDKAFRAHIVNAIVTAISKFCDGGVSRVQTRAAPPPAAKPAASEKQDSRK
jgi:N-acetylmuramoyl-L-alanine amidase